MVVRGLNQVPVSMFNLVQVCDTFAMHHVARALCDAPNGNRTRHRHGTGLLALNLHLTRRSSSFFYP